MGSRFCSGRDDVLLEVLHPAARRRRPAAPRPSMLSTMRRPTGLPFPTAPGVRSAKRSIGLLSMCPSSLAGRPDLSRTRTSSADRKPQRRVLALVEGFPQRNVGVLLPYGARCVVPCGHLGPAPPRARRPQLRRRGREQRRRRRAKRQTGCSWTAPLTCAGTPRRPLRRRRRRRPRSAGRPPRRVPCGGWRAAPRLRRGRRGPAA